MATHRRGEGAQIYNVATGTATTLLELAGVLGDILRVELRLCFHSPRTGDIRHSLGNPRLARERLGLKTETPLRQELTTVVEAPACRVPHSAFILP